MKKVYLLSLPFLFFIFCANIQVLSQIKDSSVLKNSNNSLIGKVARPENGRHYSLKGNVRDTSAKMQLANATVSILRTDSILLTFVRTDAKGNFEFKNIPSGNHIILINYPKYADYADIIETLQDEDLGSISLITKAVALQNVIVHGGGAIRLRGDTIAFMADSFKVREGANVEDLLRKLPGIQVNKKGEITAQGEKVEKVLVDGEEFFGDDPTLATQNLNASAVKEVQVFDKKSDQANFTGVDDGKKTKTINLKLKDGAKHGYFGKINLGGGLNNKWENKAMINAFKNNRKLSAFVIMSNTENANLSWDENNKFTGDGLNFNPDEGYFEYQGDDFIPNNIQGLPSSWQGGINYINKYNDNKNTLNASYRYQKLNIDGANSTNTQYILPDTQYFNNQRVHNFNSKYRHKVNGSYDLQIDSSQSLKISFNANTGKNYLNGDNYSESLAANGSPVNQNQGRNSGTTTSQALNSSLLWRKKFKKKGRTVSINFSENYNDSKTNGFLYSQTNFFKSGQLVESDTVNQKKLNNNNGLSLNTKISYTEPLSKKSVVEISYGFALNNNESKKLSFDKNNEFFDKLNYLYSNDYKFNIQTNTIGFGYKFNDKKINFGFGSDFAKSDWKQYNVFADSTRNYKFSNLFPRADFQYKISQFSSVRFNYSGRSRAPSLNQLQPILDNTNVLNIAIGNPNLKQSFSNNLRISFNTYQVLKDKGIWLSAYYNPTSNAFSTIDRTDSLARRTYQAVNVNGNYTLGANAEYFFKWKKPDLRLDFEFSPRLNRQFNYVNGLYNENNTYNYTGSFNMYKYVEKKYNFSINSSISSNKSTTSINPDVIINYWSGSSGVDAGVYLPWSFEFNTDANYEWRQKTSAYDPNTNRLLWNAKIEKKLFKNKEMKLGFRINDILNQNVGFSRFVTSNYVTQNNYDVLRRYWLLTFNWNFNKGPKKTSDDN